MTERLYYTSDAEECLAQVVNCLSEADGRYAIELDRTLFHPQGGGQPADRGWIADLAVDPATASNTSVCLRFTDARIKDAAAFAKAVTKRLEKEGVALDAGAYRDAPAGLRIWCGATVETSDVAALMPWIEYAFLSEIEAQG